jgi:hypothetical protein
MGRPKLIETPQAETYRPGVSRSYAIANVTAMLYRVAPLGASPRSASRPVIEVEAADTTEEAKPLE